MTKIARKREHGEDEAPDEEDFQETT